MLHFATTNLRKLQEAQAGCKPYDISLIQASIEIDEIQSMDATHIAKDKALRAFEILQKPAVVNDTSWSIPTLNGFPGGYMKDVMQWFRSEDFFLLLSDKPNREVVMTETVAYADGNDVKIISKDFNGLIPERPRGIGNSLENIAEFNGKTIGECRELGIPSYVAEDYIWDLFAQWYKEL